jgi:NosR/NirI family transcriptional regulator, nitrous oxide reductase regulator
MTSLLNPFSLLQRYVHWLHSQWPAGTVEKLPQVNQDGTTTLPGVRVVGDLTGIPLLKFAVDSGARAVQAIVQEANFKKSASLAPDHGGKPASLDLAIIGAGVAGIAAAIEAKKQGLHFKVFEASQPFSTIVNFPKGKPIYTYPTDLKPEGAFHVSAPTKESLLEEMESQRMAADLPMQTLHVEKLSCSKGLIHLHSPDLNAPIQARRVIIAIGRSGNYRKLGCLGEELPKVSNRLHDPQDACGKNVLVVGGGDSALETAIALASCGARVTLSYRKKEFSRPKPENISRLNDLQRQGSLHLVMESSVQSITETEVTLITNTKKETIIPNDAVFTLIGREAPLDFFRRSGIPIHGEWRTSTYAAFTAFFLFCTFLYCWKAGHPLNNLFKMNHWFPYNVGPWLESIFSLASDPSSWLGTLKISMGEGGFYYTLAYTVCIFIFGWKRIQRRKTPYITLQTSTLGAVQLLPLFILPYFLLPYLGHNGAFDSGAGKWFADEFFPSNNYGHGREYWRSFGFILAWPLFIWNVFTSKPMWGWLAVSLFQTFVIIPLIVWRWGKGAYCGWICSCGALAETLGDTQRQKMPHGPFWNRLNMIGQVILGAALLLLALRVAGWLGWKEASIFFNNALNGWKVFGGWVGLNYYFIVDIFLAGIVGVGMYFWFSGRVWCRFACPLAALMHLYARFSRFRIFPEKSKCISCNVCTSVCHQGIDVMNFANKGKPMEDPECVRCSACVQSCPTGVLSFGRYADPGNTRILLDGLAASPVQMAEIKTKGSAKGWG